jgi:hypothetical protein
MFSQAPWPHPKSTTLLIGSTGLNSGTIWFAERTAKDAKKR